MLRYSADWRSVAFLTLTAALAVVQWNLPAVNPFLYALHLFMSVTVAVMSHNHNHLSMWKSRPLNLMTSYALSIHYGFPAIAWVPTHNQNHHKLNNREGDTGRSPGMFRNNHLLALLTYPTYTGIRQQKDISAFFKGLWKRDRRAFWMGISEYVVFFGFLAGAFALDWKKALIFYVIPQQFALFAVQVFNYVQHVEAEAESPWNHSRNFVSPVLNALLFNNGYHTVHHMKPGVHWSQTPALHRQHQDKIHPSLLVKSFWAYMVWTFFLRPLVPGAKAKAPALN
ncbi:MAG TPA: fatty acid desaturase [Myxococcaceae bacterium]|nr:fatty acid desaturase [Myxococcaceae bacterium]